SLEDQRVAETGMGVSGRQPPDLGGMSVGLFLALGAWFMAGRSFWLGRGQLAGQTWRSGRVWVQPAERLLPGTDEHPTVAAVAAAASCSPCGSSHLHHQLPTGLEPSSRPGQGAGGDLWRMTVESPKGGEFEGRESLLGNKEHWSLTGGLVGIPVL
ncbi:selenoprotein M, isoform CRA_d, partial [Mus musculus]